MGWELTDYAAQGGRPCPDEKKEEYSRLIERRMTREPLQYITGTAPFFGYDFRVTPDVLIPRFDTETLVEAVLPHIKRGDRILDMCTGSGCIALAVAKTLLEDERIPPEQLPKFTLADISEPALDIARRNAQILLAPHGTLAASRFTFVRTNLFDAIPEAIKFDVILSNPPYIPHTMVDTLLQDGRSEPRLALDGDITITGDRALTQSGSPADDGLEIIRNLIPQADAHLAPYGTILMETGEYNAEKTAELARKAGFLSNIHRDLEGQLRVVEMS
jgi:release factor glutamine methyltransferase